MQIYPFQREIIQREDLAYRYAVALRANDINTLTEVLSLAIKDPKLSKLIDEIDVAFAYL
ncbi:MAG: hypothetical protein WAQ98_19265 [Blastocatellia bacterium]